MMEMNTNDIEDKVPKIEPFFRASAFALDAGINNVRTEETYLCALRQFARWLPARYRDEYGQAIWPLDPAALTNAMVFDYRNWLLRNRSKSTVTTYLAAIVGFLVYLEDCDRLPAEINLGKLQRQLARCPVKRNLAEGVVNMELARQGVPRIVQYYDELPLPLMNDGYNRRLAILRNRAIVNLLYSTGARILEMAALDRLTVDDGCAPYALITGKGSKGRTIYIRRYARSAILVYLAERQDANPALFVSHSRNSLSQRITITSIHNIVKHAVDELDLDPRLSAHDFRHFRATQLLRKGMPLEVLQEYMGHVDIGTTRSVYAPVLGVQLVSSWLDKKDRAPDEALRRWKSK